MVQCEFRSRAGPFRATGACTRGSHQPGLRRGFGGRGSLASEGVSLSFAAAAFDGDALCVAPRPPVIHLPTLARGIRAFQCGKSVLARLQHGMRERDAHPPLSMRIETAVSFRLDVLIRRR